MTDHISDPLHKVCTTFYSAGQAFKDVSSALSVHGNSTVLGDCKSVGDVLQQQSYDLQSCWFLGRLPSSAKAHKLNVLARTIGQVRDRLQSVRTRNTDDFGDQMAVLFRLRSPVDDEIARCVDAVDRPMTEMDGILKEVSESRSQGDRLIGQLQNTPGGRWFWDIFMTDQEPNISIMVNAINDHVFDISTYGDMGTLAQIFAVPQDVCARFGVRDDPVHPHILARLLKAFDTRQAPLGVSGGKRRFGGGSGEGPLAMCCGSRDGNEAAERANMEDPDADKDTEDDDNSKDRSSSSRRSSSRKGKGRQDSQGDHGKQIKFGQVTTRIVSELLSQRAPPEAGASWMDLFASQVEVSAFLSRSVTRLLRGKNAGQAVGDRATAYGQLHIEGFEQPRLMVTFVILSQDLADHFTRGPQPPSPQILKAHTLDIYPRRWNHTGRMPKYDYDFKPHCRLGGKLRRFFAKEAREMHPLATNAPVSSDSKKTISSMADRAKSREPRLKQLLISYFDHFQCDMRFTTGLQ